MYVRMCVYLSLYIYIYIYIHTYIHTYIYGECHDALLELLELLVPGYSSKGGAVGGGVQCIGVDLYNKTTYTII